MKNEIPKSSWEAVRMAVEEVHAALAGWEGAQTSPERSYDLLVIWAHSMRFRAETLNRSEVHHLGVVVRDNADTLIETAVRVPSPLEGYEARAQALDGQWGTVEDDERHSAEILRHFIAFDRERLFTQAVSFLLGLAPGEWHQEFLAREKRVGEVAAFVQAHPDLFITVADYAQVMLGAYRTDLGALDVGDPANAPLMEVMDHLWVFWRIRTAPHFCAGERATVFVRPNERAAIRALMGRRKS